MRLAGLCFYQSGVCALLCVLFSLMSVAPGAESMHALFFYCSAAGAVVMLGLALGLKRFPAEHRVHSSKPLRAALTVSAAVLTVAAVLII